MKRILGLLIVAFYTIVIACTNDFGGYEENQPKNSVNVYAVSVDEAVKTLNELLSDNKLQITRSDINAITLSKSDFLPNTRGSSDDIPVVYILNFGEQGGTAIMAADMRMKPIYAVVEKDGFTQNDILVNESVDNGEIEQLRSILSSRIRSEIIEDLEKLSEFEMETRAQVLVDEAWLVTRGETTCGPLLETKWGQGSPYNDLEPMWEDGKRYYAGCVTIAIAQILTYFQQPSAINGVAMDWNLLSNCVYGHTMNADERAEVAKFVHQIGTCLDLNRDSEYGTAGSTIGMASLFFLLKTPLQDVTTASYNWNVIKPLLADYGPVYVRGFATYLDYEGNEETSGHAWIVDGYYSKTEECWWRQYHSTDPLDFTDTMVGLRYTKLLHCNYGWDGSCDGYYTEGIFNTLEGPERIDVECGDEENNQIYNFDTGLRMITYTY